MLLLNQRGKIFLTLIINIDSHNSMCVFQNQQIQLFDKSL